MNRITLGIVCGLGFGLLDAILMLPMPFPNKPVRLPARSSTDSQSGS
jgi:hypothetical protein